MTDYDKNTQLTAQGAEQNAEPPVESHVVQKKGLADKIAGALLSDDYRVIFSNIYRSIVEPAIKKLAVEAFKAFVYRGKPSGETFDSYVPYDSYSSGSAGSESRPHREFGPDESGTQGTSSHLRVGLLQDCKPEAGSVLLQLGVDEPECGVRVPLPRRKERRGLDNLLPRAGIR